MCKFIGPQGLTCLTTTQSQVILPVSISDQHARVLNWQGDAGGGGFVYSFIANGLDFETTAEQCTGDCARPFCVGSCPTTQRVLAAGNNVFAAGTISSQGQTLEWHCVADTVNGTHICEGHEVIAVTPSNVPTMKPLANRLQAYLDKALREDNALNHHIMAAQPVGRFAMSGSDPVPGQSVVNGTWSTYCPFGIKALQNAVISYSLRLKSNTQGDTAECDGMSFDTTEGCPYIVGVWQGDEQICEQTDAITTSCVGKVKAINSTVTVKIAAAHGSTDFYVIGTEDYEARA